LSFAIYRENETTVVNFFYRDFQVEKPRWGDSKCGKLFLSQTLDNLPHPLPSWNCTWSLYVEQIFTYESKVLSHTLLSRFHLLLNNLFKQSRKIGYYQGYSSELIPNLQPGFTGKTCFPVALSSVLDHPLSQASTTEILYVILRFTSLSDNWGGFHLVKNVCRKRRFSEPISLGCVIRGQNSHVLY
jgi:hypothetical protein